MDKRGVIRLITISSNLLAYVVLVKIILGFAFFLFGKGDTLARFYTPELLLAVALFVLSIPLSVLEWKMGVNGECISCDCWVEKKVPKITNDCYPTPSSRCWPSQYETVRVWRNKEKVGLAEHVAVTAIETLIFILVIGGVVVIPLALLNLFGALDLNLARVELLDAVFLAILTRLSTSVGQVEWVRCGEIYDPVMVKDD